MKYSAVKRQLLEDQVESAKCLLSCTAEIERNRELEISPYLKSELSHLQKYVDQLSTKPKSPFGLYRRTEQEDLSYCLHRKHSKSMKTITGLMSEINKELYRLKKLKQAEKKLEFLELFQARDMDQLDDVGQLSSNPTQNSSSRMNQYKLPESKGPFIPQLASPKPKYEPMSLHTEEEKPEMSRAMEGFLKQQEKERKEKEMKQQQLKEFKPVVSAFIPTVSSSGMKEDREGDRMNLTQQQQNFSSAISPNPLKENPLSRSDDDKVDSVKEKNAVDSNNTKPLSFSGLRKSGPTNKSHRSIPYTSSDPERPYGAYSNDNGPYSQFLSSLGRSSGTTFENLTKSGDDKSRGAYY
jgi:hypothetical protein